MLVVNEKEGISMTGLLRMFRRKRSARPSRETVWTAALPGEARGQALDLYLLPRNVQEMHRLDFQHYFLRQVLRGNFVAPIGSAIRSVLDVGCGTGRWPQEMALLFPHAQVVGFDLDCARHTRLPGVVDNYRFVEGNILSGLPFVDQSFDFSHMRFLVAGLPARQWPFAVSELARVTSISGWVELVEAGNTFLRAGPATQQFLQWWVSLSLSRGIDAAVVERLGLLLEQAGLRLVRTHEIDLPVGAWGKGEQRRVGDLLAKDMLTGFPGLKEPCCSLLHISPDEFDQVLRALPEEWARLKTLYRFYVAYGMR
jgi:SAM-dependent methyltransferase